MGVFNLLLETSQFLTSQKEPMNNRAGVSLKNLIYCI